MKTRKYKNQSILVNQESNPPTGVCLVVAVTPLCSYTPMFLHPYVPPYTPLCSSTPMFLHPYVPTTYVPTPLCSYNLCSYTPMFLHPYVPTPYVPTPLCSYTPMFLRPYVPTPLYSFPPIFRHFLLDQHCLSGTN